MDDIRRDPGYSIDKLREEQGARWAESQKMLRAISQELRHIRLLLALALGIAIAALLLR